MWTWWIFLTQNELNWVWFGCFCYLLSETACGIASQSWKLQAPGMSLIGCIIFHFSWPIYLGRAKVRSRSRRCTYWFREGETEMIALWHNQSVKRFYPVLFVWHYFFKELHPPSQTAVVIIPASGLLHFKFPVLTKNTLPGKFLLFLSVY